MLRRIRLGRGSHRRCSVKKVLKNFANFTEKRLCWSLFLTKETPIQVLFCEICMIFKNTNFEENLLAAVAYRDCSCA